jgi:hypothetical protein
MQLTISKQDSLYTEKLVKNGAPKEVHYVVKNTPFTIDYKIENFNEKSAFNFHKCKIECSLLYDVKPPRSVDYVNKKPMEYVIHSNQKGDECSVEFRIKVLTTQLEGSLFLIKAMLWNSKDKSESLECLSKCIKTVSKPEQVRKKIAQNNKNGKETGVTTTTSTPSRKKRTRSDELLETLQNIQEQQNRQMEMMNNLYGYMYNFTCMSMNNVMNNNMDYQSQLAAPQNMDNQMVIDNNGNFMQPNTPIIESEDCSVNNNVVQSPPNCPVNNNIDQSLPNCSGNNMVVDSIPNCSANDNNMSGSSPDCSGNNMDDFDVAFHNLVQCYKKINPSERPSKIRKLFQDNSNNDDVFDIFQNISANNIAENNQQQTSGCGQYLSLDTCSCNNCPAKQELDQLSKFYMEFLQQEDCKV